MISFFYSYDDEFDDEQGRQYYLDPRFSDPLAANDE